MCFLPCKAIININYPNGVTDMNKIFSGIPLPDASPACEYECRKGAYMLIYENCCKADFDEECKKAESRGFSLFDSFDIKENYHRTYRSDIMLHIYYCESERKMRIVADTASAYYHTQEEKCEKKFGTTVWQFEVDHALIDCGMCYIIRCCDGSFFVIDSAHMYSVNDDVRIVEFLTKLSGGKKPVVAGWFLSHAHEDHIAKFLDVIEYHKNEIDIETVYYNFPDAYHRDYLYWGEVNLNMTLRFERIMEENPDIKKVILHTGQRFFVRNLEFVTLCTHEDVYPTVFSDFNNTSTALMMFAEGSKVLFPGDCSAESDKVLVGRYGDYLKCDVVQMSHHGHSGTSPDFYRYADAECVLFPITEIKFYEELPRQESNRVAMDISKEYYIASNGTVEIPLPYKFGQTKVYPDETFEDFNGIFRLWCYEYTDEYKQKLYNEFLERSKK